MQKSTSARPGKATGPSEATDELLSTSLNHLRVEQPDRHAIIGGAILRHFDDPGFGLEAFLATWQDRTDADMLAALGEWADKARVARWEA